MSRRTRAKSRQISRRNERLALRRKQKAPGDTAKGGMPWPPRDPVWCDCCGDAPATVTTWTCPRCGFLAIAPVEVAHADLNAFMDCPNCMEAPT